MRLGVRINALICLGLVALGAPALWAADRVSITIGGYVPARCEIEVISEARAADRMDVVIQRFCNVPVHSFVVNYTLPAEVTPEQVRAVVSENGVDVGPRMLTDDRVIVRLEAEGIDSETADELFDSLAMRFEISPSARG